MFMCEWIQIRLQSYFCSLEVKNFRLMLNLNQTANSLCILLYSFVTYKNRAVHPLYIKADVPIRVRQTGVKQVGQLNRRGWDGELL